MFGRRSRGKSNEPDTAPPETQPVSEPLFAGASIGLSASPLLKMLKRPTKSVIGPDLVIEGNVLGEGEIEVLGEIRGEMRCPTLVVTDPGTVTGDVFAKTAHIDGHVHGTIRSDNVHLKTHAHVRGDIYHASLVIEHGAVFEGKVRRSNNPTKATADGNGTVKAEAAPAAPETPAEDVRPAWAPYQPVGQ